MPTRRRILVNLVIDGEQGRTRRNAELEADCHNLLDAHVDVGAAAQLGTVDIVSEFRSALATLPRRQRAVIVLRYWEDLPEADVAALLECSVGTVKSTASRGLARLREVMGATAPPAPRIASSGTHERTPLSC